MGKFLAIVLALLIMFLSAPDVYSMPPDEGPELTDEGQPETPEPDKSCPDTNSGTKVPGSGPMTKMVQGNSEYPVVYGNGRMVFSKDVLGVHFGATGNLRQELNYINVTNDRENFDGIFGNNVIDDAAPYLSFGDDAIQFVLNPNTKLRFTGPDESGKYVADRGTATLVHDDENDRFYIIYEYALRVYVGSPGFSPAGTASGVAGRKNIYKYEFYDNTWTEGLAGRLISVTLDGVSAGVTGYNNGLPEEKMELYTIGENVVSLSLAYSYYTEGPHDGNVEFVSLERSGDGRAGIYRYAEYIYYGESEPHGSLNDVKMVHAKDASGNPVATHYFRYYKGEEESGFESGLKYYFGPEAYARLYKEFGETISMQSDSAVAPYADFYYKYVDSGEFVKSVSKEVASGACGCSSLGGLAGDLFEYETNPNYPQDMSSYNPFNVWKTKTTITHADGNQEIVYANSTSGVMLKVFREAAASPVREWRQFVSYDVSGYQVLVADSDAVTGYDETKMDLVHLNGGNYEHLSDTQGVIAIYDVADADDQEDGRVKGYAQGASIKRGELGDLIPVLKYEYAFHEESGVFSYPLAKKIEYPDASNDAIQIVTSYATVLRDGTLQAEQKTITLPNITAQNGSGAGSIVEVFGEYGNNTWIKDEHGRITRMIYDVTMGLVTQKIDDVNTNLVDDEPSGWSTVSGGGKHLVTDYEYDGVGRLIQTLAPVHEVDLAGVSTSVRQAQWWVYHENAAHVPNEVWTAFGYATGSAPNYTFTMVGPASIITQDKIGREIARVTSSRTSGTGKLNSTDTFARSDWKTWSASIYNNRGLLTTVRQYHTIPTTGEGSEGTNYDEVTMAYDSLGRVVRVVGPSGTIERTVYDARGNVASKWVGTNDTDATADDPTGGSATGNNMAKVTEYEYDGGNAGGNGNLTSIIQHVDDAPTTRTTTMTYDWRNRLETIEGEENVFSKLYYDNLDRLVKSERYDGPAGNLISRTETAYDDRGRVYRTTVHEVDPSTGTPGETIVTNNWHDAGGNIIKTMSNASGSMFVKFAYDSLDRLVATYIGYDLDESSYADALTVAGDTILEQVETAYDDAGNVIQVTSRQRLNDATGEGELTTIAGSQPKARVTYSATWHDGIGRPVASADYGTNGDAAFTRPTTIPSASDTVLLATVEYDAAGRMYKTTDPKGIETRIVYDDAGRQLQTIENYDDGDPTTGSTAADRITEYTYTPDSQIATLKALMPNPTDDQVTTYVYGVSTASGSQIHSNSLLRAVIYPDSDDPSNLSGDGTDTLYDRVELTYNRLGQLIERKDQREVVQAYDYDDLGRLIHSRITSLGRGGENVDGSVRRISRTYEVRGMLASITSHDNASPGSGSVLNEVAYTYNSFGQLISEHQEHDGAASGGTLAVGLAYEDGSTAAGIRPTKLIYPNGREVHYLYTDAGDTNGIGHAVGRVNAIASASTRGSSDVNVIAAYTYLGMASPIRKDYPTPQIRLDHWGGTAGSFDGIDRFGRITDHRWVNYSSGEKDMFRILHGYDRASNRLYADNQVYKGASQTYGYDNLHRLINNENGQITSSQDDIEPHWQSGLGSQSWNLDPVGNQQAVSDRGESDFVENTHNKANEYTTRKTNGSRAKSAFAIADFNTNTTSLWDKPGSGDAFDVDSTTANRLTVTTVAQDTFDLHQESEARAMLTLGQAVGPVQGRVTLQFPSGATTGYAGLVFGYKSANDYWMVIVDLADQEQRVYHVVDGNKTQVGVDAAVTVAATTDYVLSLQSTRSAIQGDVAADLANGFPSGRIGLITTVANTQFDNLYLYGDHQSRNLAGRWENYRGDVMSPGSDGVNAIDTSIDRLKLYNDSVSSHKPVLLRGLNVGRFEATFNVKRESAGSSDHGVGFVFNAKDQDSFDSVHIFHHDSAQAPLGWEQDDGHLMSAVAASTNTGSIPALTSSDTLWVQVNNDGTNVTVKLATSKAGLSTAGVSFTSSAYDGSGTPSGQIGFVTTGTHGQIISIGDFELAADRDNNGSYETLEHVDNFAIDSGGQAEETLTHDAAGNLTYDGVYAYTYDAWNRLTKMHKAFRNPASPSTVTNASLITQNTYNGSGKRITKAITNAGYLNETYSYFYTPGWQLIETRNTSGQVIKQHLWGTQYIDELIQIAINGEPVDDPTFDSEDPDHDFRGYWAMQDSNYNVLGIADSSGSLIERYEYTPYGKRTVFHTPGSSDQLAMAASPLSRRVMASGALQSYGINESGHQGLVHEEGGLAYNRARHLHLDFGFYSTRDIRQYIDGANQYEYARSAPTYYLDPTGMDTYCQNRQLNPNSDPSRDPVEWIVSHTFVFTTRHVNGVEVVENTYSWGNTYDENGDANWHRNASEDISAAIKALQQRETYENAPFWQKPFLADNFEEPVGGEWLDFHIEAAFNDRQNDPNHASRHSWQLFNNCKQEADRLIEDARDRLDAEMANPANLPIRVNSVRCY